MTWILIANRVGARIVLQEGEQWTSIAELPNEHGRLRNQDLDSDRPGRTFSRTTAARHALEPGETSHDLIAERFARDLAEHLAHARMAGKFERLMLVAEPRLLGMLRAALDPVTARCVIGSVNKDLQAVEVRDLAEHLH